MTAALERLRDPGAEPVLVVFDVDGTLVDSAAAIAEVMARAFAAEGLAPPAEAAVRAVIGLSLDEAIARLAPDLDGPARARLVAGYRAAFLAAAEAAPAAEARRMPLFPGVRETLERLAALDAVLLGIATGKSRRGVARLLDLHGLGGLFHSVQTADDHPSKPHPAMLEAALAETGVAPGRALLVGDTTHDVAMARAAGVAALGVSWGCHPPEALARAGAWRLAERPADILAAVGALAAGAAEGAQVS
ncbi:MAG: HAD family hydrolase [Alphaproteobacteria bacterium]|nr:MAG: HAD family hydrolase [Alphaproteobacteria bacterium]